jgi:hypothetical protein
MKSPLKIILIILLLVSTSLAYAPSSPDQIQITGNETKLPQLGAKLNNTGGTITSINFSVTTQNFKWKGYVGNINGSYALSDSSLNALFEWDIQTTTGKIYATRNPLVPSWDQIGCALNQDIYDEESELDITSTDVDSINSTFNQTTHDEFYASITRIPQNSCRSINLNVNGEKQDQYFEEILLSDGNNLVYTSLIENSATGYNGKSYDFQMIVPDNANVTSETSEAYYFYIELI